MGSTTMGSTMTGLPRMRYDDRVFMYDPALRPVVLAKLAKWSRLTESDLHSMLRPEDRVRLRPDLLRDLEWEGLITIRPIGDEPVLAITDQGREWAAQQGMELGAARPAPRLADDSGAREGDGYA